MKDRKRIAIGGQVYRDGRGFLLRLLVDGKKTWRKLKAGNEREARIEAAGLLAVRDQTGSNSTSDPFKRLTVGALIERYLAAGCPNGRLEAQSPVFQSRHQYLLKRPQEFLGAVGIEQLRIPLVLQYGKWARDRMTRQTRGNGSRTMDMEICALSCAYRWAMSMGLTDTNPLLGRPRFQRTSEVRSCREVAPTSSNELHQIADRLFESPRSETLGWQFLMLALTGCRTSEILRCRMDAVKPEQPGFMDGGYLFIQRSKRGVHNFASIHPDLDALIRAHRIWHAQRFPQSPWWFPGQDPSKALDKGALAHAMSRVCAELGLPHRSVHGLRSYFVTTRRSQAVADWEIASEIGDKTVDLIHKTYGERPLNYRGGSLHGWLPRDRPPAWAMWLGEPALLKAG